MFIQGLWTLRVRLECAQTSWSLPAWNVDGKVVDCMNMSAVSVIVVTVVAIVSDIKDMDIPRSQML